MSEQQQAEILYRDAIIEQLRQQIGTSAVDLADARAKLEAQAHYNRQLEAQLKKALERNSELEGLLPEQETATA